MIIKSAELILHSRGSGEYAEAGGQPVVTALFPESKVSITAEIACAIGRAGNRLVEGERRAEAEYPKEHKPLPILGYNATEPQSKVDLVNSFKAMEERVLRELDALAQREDQIDKRWLAIGRTHLEQAFMCVNRSIFQPQRAKLPEDINAS